MYSVLIAEDEMLVRLGLKNSIDWGKFGMAVIADVPDGQSAWQIYRKEHPDVIITDLRMPVMGGMELISKIREKDRDTPIIILSCLEEFELARKAMSLGVSDYILKMSMTEEEMEAVLQKTVNELAARRNSREEKTLAPPNLDIVKEKFIKDFIFYKLHSDAALQSFVEEHGLRLCPYRMFMCILEIDHFENLQSLLRDEKGMLIRLSMLNVLDEILTGYERGEVVYDDERHYILLFSFSDFVSEQRLMQELNSILENICKSLQAFFNLSVTVAVSKIFSGYENLKKAYEECFGILESKFYCGGGMVLYETIISKEQIIKAAESLQKPPEVLEKMGESVVGQYRTRLCALIDLAVQSKKQALEAFLQLLQWTTTVLCLQGSDLTTLMSEYDRKLQKSETLEECSEYYRAYVDRISDGLRKSNGISKEIHEAVSYMEANYCRDISLQQVAEHVNLSNSYFSTLFKKEMQVTFVDYLNCLRTEKVKQMLLHTPMKSYEISQMLGFNDETYFSRFFKKQTGMSPGEFRRKWRRDWVEGKDNGKQV